MNAAVTLPAADETTTCKSRLHALVIAAVLLSLIGGAASAQMVITSVTPSSGVAGTIMLIQGTGFSGTTGATMGQGATPLTFSVRSDSEITVQIPTTVPIGSVSFCIESASGSDCSVFLVLASGPPAAITSISPTKGWPNTTVKILGQSLSLTTYVFFDWLGNRQLASSSVIHDGEVRATVPSGAASGKIFISTPSGDAISDQTYTVIAQPTVTAVDPSSGATDALIRFTGTGFSDSTNVTFGGVTSPNLSATDTTITARVPSAVMTGPACVQFDAGSICAPGVFTPLFSTPLPSITSITPAAGTPGSPVVIRGSGLTGATAVKFNGVDSPTFTVNYDAEITAGVPSTATSGPVTITTPAGTSSGFDFPICTPTPPTITAAPAVCAGQADVAASTDPVAGATFNWSLQDTSCATSPCPTIPIKSGQGTPSILFDVPANAAGPLKLTLSIAGCAAEASQLIAVNTIAQPLITAPPSVCAGGRSTAYVTPAGVSSSWSISNGTITAGQGTGTITFTAGTSGSVSLSVDVYDTCGVATATGSVDIGVPTATISPAGPTTICAGASVTLTASGGSSYSWSNGATTASITVSPGSTTTYGVTVTDATGCTATASRTVTVNVPVIPTVTASAASFCAGGSATLTATDALSYQWLRDGTPISGATARTYVATVGGNYSVTTIDANGCTATSGNVTIIAASAPSVAITGPIAVCSGGTATLNATAGFASYKWSTGATTQNITVSVNATTTYTVTATDSNGCSASASHTIRPTAGSAPITAPASVCAKSSGNEASVVPQAGAAYLWTITNGTLTSPADGVGVTFTAAASGDVVLSVTVTTGSCSVSASKTVAVSTPPTVVVTGPASVCAGTPVTLDAGAGYVSYLWSNGATTRTITLSPAVLTSGVVTVSDSGGCAAIGSYSVAVLPAPNATISAPASVVSGSATNNASVAAGPAGTSYAWSVDGGVITAGAGTSAITFAPASNNPVTLSVRVTSAEGCSASGSATVPVTTAVCTGTAPAPVSPADAATGLTSPVTFTWSAAPGATQHELWIAVDGAPPQLAATTSGTTTSATVAVNGTSAAWYTVALFEACPTLLSPRRSLTLAPSPACASHGAATPISPASTAGSTNVTFSWSAVTGASAYRVWISVDNAPAEDVATTADGATTTRTASVPEGAISWYVETLFAGCPSTRSTSLSFTIPKPDPCANRSAAVLSAPANMATTSSSVEFRWLASAGASGYRLWVSQDGAPWVHYGSTATGTSLRGSFAGGHFDWYVEALFAGCASVNSAPQSFDIPKASACGTEVAALTSPAAGEALTARAVTFRWNDVPNATGYEVFLGLNSGTPVLLATTTSASVTYEVPAGSLEWFVRTRFEGCDARDSLHRRFTFTPPAGCATAAPIITSPGGLLLYWPYLSWRAVPGATSYNVWVSLFGIFSPSLFKSPTTQTDLGGPMYPIFSWSVEATMGGGCPTVRSGSRYVMFIPLCLGRPSIVSPTMVSSGVPYTVRWSEASFNIFHSPSQIQESHSGTFADATTSSSPGNAQEFTHVNPTSAPDTWYYRARTPDCFVPGLLGAYSKTVAVTILPSVAEHEEPTVVLPSDAHVTLVNSGILIPGSSPLPPPFRQLDAGFSFTATPDQPWLTVTPASGVVPATGLTLNVTADTSNMPVGTTSGTVTITTFSGAASGRAAGHATSTTTRTVSVNLVQPVVSKPRDTPPPDALIIPAVAHADGVSSKFRSDVRLANTAPQPMTYQLTFTPSGAEGVSGSRQTMIDVDSGRTVALDDVLGTWFNSGVPSSMIGTLEIRPLTDSVLSTSGSAATGLQNTVTFATSRTFSTTDKGTFGQFVPAIPFSRFIGRSADPNQPAVLSLQQISQNASYRTNLGLVEGSGEAASVLVSVFDASGTKLTEFTVDLAGGQHLQMNSFLSARNIQVTDGRTEVKVTSPGGRVTAYASVLDNRTGDPLLVTPANLSSSGTTKYVVPGVADLQSGLARWQTDVRVLNASSTPVDATLTFYSQNAGEAPRTTKVTFAPNEIRRFDATLSTLFGATNNGGALHIETASPSNLVPTARTYAQTSAGTYGQFVEAVTQADAADIGSRALQILQVEESSRFRSNIGLAEIAGKSADVQIGVSTPDGRTTTTSVSLKANEFRQLPSLLKEMGLMNSYNARVSVKVVGGEGRVIAYASVIDSVTQDPTYVPAQ